MRLKSCKNCVQYHPVKDGTEIVVECDYWGKSNNYTPCSRYERKLADLDDILGLTVYRDV